MHSDISYLNLILTVRDFVDLIHEAVIMSTYPKHGKAKRFGCDGF